VNNPYFLTRQSANLIEDFAREIGRGSSLFLLYGESGVGKSSLLRQIREKRLDSVNTHWLDFNEIPAKAGGETTSDPVDLALVLKALADKANAGDVIFIDHFESASNRAQHQLFESWSIDGRDKQLNFIVATESSSFTIFRHLAQQMQIDARSFQLMPCSQAEAETYVKFVLFPEEPFAKLLMSSSLKQQLRACNGVFASLTEFAEHEGGQITIDRNVDEKSNVIPGVIKGILLVAIFAAGYLTYSTWIREESVAVDITQEPGREVPSSKESRPAVPEQQVEAKMDQLDQLDEQIEVRKTDTEVAVQPPLVSKTTEVENTELESSETEVVVEDKIEVSPFQSLLEKSKHWIENSKSESGTIQIMTVGLDRFGSEEFEKYQQKLLANNVDLARLHLFQTEVNNQKMFIIVYGEYPSRRKAGLQIKTLPKALVAAKPFPRTIGGILNEIEKIEN